MNQERTIVYISVLLSSIEALIPSRKNGVGVKPELKELISQTPILQPFLKEIEEAVCGHVFDKAVDIVAPQLDKKTSDNTLLNSIFSGITLGEKPRKNPWKYQPTSVSVTNPDIDSALFPANVSFNDAKIKEAKGNVWKAFSSEYQHIQQSNSLIGYSHSLFELFSKYASRVRSVFQNDDGDISLFDHARMIAAVSNCLSLVGNQPEKPGFLLLIGDLSGIQDFIYSNIDTSEAGSTKGLAKRLRGRSYYVSLLTDVIAEEFIKEFEVNTANILYAGGGGFQLLLPNVTEFEQKLQALTQKINQFLFERIDGKLGLVTGYSKTTEDIFHNSSQYIQHAYDQLDENKSRKFEDNLDYLFYKYPISERSKFKDDEILGENIPYGKLILEIHAPNLLKIAQQEPHASLEFFGRYFFVINDREGNHNQVDVLNGILKSYQDQIEWARLLSLNDTAFLEPIQTVSSQFSELDIRAGYKFIGSYAPLKSIKGKDAVMEFSDISKRNHFKQDEELSYPKMAVMRLDVDNLGSLFALGFGKESSFARVATMSRELHIFFSGYFNQIAKKYELYVTYSGGDDAFVVGSWLNVMHGALELYEAFKKFTCENPELTFSAGIFMCSEHYPVAKFAKKAGEAEKRAKDFRNGSKDAICVFGQVLSWKQYKEMLELADTILSYVESGDSQEKGKLSRSLIHRLHTIIKRCISEDGELKPKLLYRQTARLHYLFARQSVPGSKNGYNHGKMETVRQKVEANQSLDLGDEIAHHVIRIFLEYFKHDGDKKNLLGNLLIPTSYITYKTRTLENK